MQAVHKKAVIVVRHLDMGRAIEVENVLKECTPLEAAAVAYEVTLHFTEMSQNVKVVYFKRILERALMKDRNNGKDL